MANSEIKQLNKVYQSTISFFEFLKKNKVFKKDNFKMLDAGCGIGANIFYFSKKLPKASFIGVDYLNKRIQYARKINKNNNVDFFVDDMNKKNKIVHKDIDLITCVHTLCCFKKLNKPLKYMFKFNPKWIAINSLFYEGFLDVLIHIRDHENLTNDNNVNSDFNIFSLPYFKKELKKTNYRIYKYKKFFPNKNIKKPQNGKRGSYTIKTEFNRRTIFSGPVHLPWYFVLLKKI